MPSQYQLFLIEDDEDIALLIQRSLERAGHQLTRCRTAADALIVLSHGKFDLVILDQVLPDMSGLELLKRLSQENVTVPVLMVTAHGDEELATRSLQAGVLDYLVKDHALTFLAELPRRVEECITQFQLRQLNRLLVQSLESAGDGIMITDLQGNILHVNQGLIEMSGYSREELLGRKPSLLKSGQHSPELYSQMWKAILSRNVWQGELFNRRKDGRFFEVSLTISPIVDGQGRLTHFVGIQRDISERKQLHQQVLQAQKMQSIGTLAGGVAHEFNNLLAGISGYASLGIREPELTPILKEFLQHILDLSERAALLTQQLLAFARKPALTRRPTSLGQLLRDTASLVDRTMHIEVEVELPPTITAEQQLIVEADANQLQQAIINLTLNAKDATKQRLIHEAESTEVLLEGAMSPVRYRASAVNLEEEIPAFPQSIYPGDYVVIEVEDQGTGMSPDVVEQALDPFFTTKEVGSGTGLGLSVVFGIMQAHSGSMTLRTVEGKGTTVSLYLPRLETAQVHSRKVIATSDSWQISDPVVGSQATILVIDDEQAVLDVVTRFLEIAGHQVISMTSGEAGLAYVQQHGLPDLVILDLLMPKENSRVTFQKFRERSAQLPVLVCTGTMSSEDVQPLLDEGASGLLRKPFRMTELWHTISETLENASQLSKES